MNIDNLNKLIDILSDEPGYPGLPKFDMAVTYHDANKTWPVPNDIDVKHTCGSSACILGYAALLAKRDGYDLKDVNGFRGAGMRYLEVDMDIVEDIGFDGDAMQATKQDAVKMLTHLRDTGVVDWSVINEEVKVDEQP